MDYQLSAAGRPDENLLAEVIGPFWFSKEEMVKSRRLLYFSLQKGQIRANIFYQPQISANLEVLQIFFSIFILQFWKYLLLVFHVISCSNPSGLFLIL